MLHYHRLFFLYAIAELLLVGIGDINVGFEADEFFGELNKIEVGVATSGVDGFVATNVVIERVDVGQQRI